MHIEMFLPPAAFSDDDLAAMNRLMVQLSTREANVTHEDVIAAGKSSRLLLARNEAEALCGMATLVVYRKLRGLEGRVEDVVVDQAHRGRGVAKLLLNALIAVAKTYPLRSLHLTSHPSRVAANQLYRSLGFQLHETNVYRLVL